MPHLSYSILGDSISTFEGVTPEGFTLFYNGERLEKSGVTTPGDTWWGHVIKALAGELVADNAWSGSMVEGAGFPAASSEKRARAILGPDGAQPDAVLVFIGINDYGWGGAANQAAGRSHAMPRCVDLASVPERVAADAPENAAQLFGKAYRAMLGHIRQAAPQALVYCITLLPGRTQGVDHAEFAYRLRGVHLDEYNDAIRAAATDAGCRVVDVRSFGRDYDSLEATHPTNLGMRQFASMVVRGMQIADEQAGGGATAGANPEAANPALDLTDFCGAPKSEEACERESCIGCPHAANTGNQWLCRCLK